MLRFVLSLLALSSATPQPKVFGIGLACTGNTALTAAFEMLGYSTIQHDAALVPFLYPDRIYNFTRRYDHVDAVVGDPVSHYYAEMLREYPDAKFVLTARPSSDWLTSFAQHMARTRELYGNALPFRVKSMIETMYGTSEDEPATWLAKYNTHNTHVQRVIPKSQLLELDVSGEGAWQQLCAFLDRTDGRCGDAAGALPRERSEEARAQHAERERIISVKEIVSNRPGNTTRYAYVALLVNASDPGKRDYLVSLLVAIESLKKTQPKHDVIIMVNGPISPNDTLLLQSAATRIVHVKPIGANLDRAYDDYDVDIAGVYRAKVRALQLIEYEQVIYFDTDILFNKNCDKVFAQNAGLMGRPASTSPLNAGFLVLQPSIQSLNDINDVALTGSYRADVGWLEYGLIPGSRTSQGRTIDWSFYGACTDQGLFFYYYALLKKTAWIRYSQLWDDAYVHYAGDIKPLHISHPSQLPQDSRIAYLDKYRRIYKALQIRFGDLVKIPTWVSIYMSLLLR